MALITSSAPPASDTKQFLEKAVPDSPDEFRDKRWPDRAITGTLFFGVMTIYLAVLRGKVEVYDTGTMLDVTKNLVGHGSLMAAGGGYWTAGRWAPYGIGVSLAAVPAYALSLWTGHFGVVVFNRGAASHGVLDGPHLSHSQGPRLASDSRTDRRYQFRGAVDGPLVHGRAAERTGGHSVRPRHRLRDGQVETGEQARPTLGRDRRGLRYPVPCGLHCHRLHRPALDPAVRVVESAEGEGLRRTAARSFGGELGLLGWYNYLRFGRIFVSSYNRGGFSTPLWHGLDGLLFSAGRSIFVFDPLTIAGVFGLLLILFGPKNVRDRPLGVLCFLLVVPRIIFFAKWNTWDGAAVWGPRFLLPAVAILSLTIVPLLRATDIRRISGALVRVVLVILATAAAGVSYLSVRIPLGEWLAVLKNPVWRVRLGIRGLLTPVQQNHALDFGWRTSPIWGYLTLLRLHLAKASGDLWIDGHGVVGYTLLGVGCVLLVAAAVEVFVLKPSRIDQSLM